MKRKSTHLAQQVLQLFCLLLALLLSAGSTVWAQTDPPVATVIVRLAPAAYQQVADLPVVHTIDYGSFVWLELLPASFARLQASGVPFAQIQGPSQLTLANPVQPVLTGRAPTADAAQGVQLGVASFHIVQLLGPAKEQWLQTLRASGAEIIQFSAPYAYLVRSTPESAAQIAGLAYVRWVAPLAPANRIGAALRDKTGLIQNVRVTLYDDGKIEGSLLITLQEIEALGGRLLNRERANPASPLEDAIFELSADQVNAVAALNTVLWVDYQLAEWLPEDEMSSQIMTGDLNPSTPNYQTWLNNQGLSGTGVTVALIDTGYDSGVDATSHQDLRGRMIPVGTPNDTNGHGTHVGGIIAGNGALGTNDASGFRMGQGVAPGANMVVIDYNDVTNDINNQTQLQSDSVTRGAVVSNNSYRLQDPSSGYSALDRIVDTLVRDANPSTTVAEPMTIVFSAGNSGTGGPTKEPKNAVAVGSTENMRDVNGNPTAGANSQAISDFSSRGPAGDGRIYPHVVAPGENIISTRSNQSDIFECDGLAANSPTMGDRYTMCSGTSMAAPHVTGAVALITEWWRGFNGGANPSPAMVKALLVNSATDIGTPDIPNNEEGWGLINLNNLFASTVPNHYQDQTTIFDNTGDQWRGRFVLIDPRQPIKVTVAWSDAPGPGTGGSTIALVNDLDLVVNSGGQSFVGNNFAGGQSQTGGAANDTRNNLENVYATLSGEFEVVVTAAGINGDGVPQVGDGTDQDFALVIHNAVPALANVSVAITAAPEPVRAGAEVSYVFKVSNDGPTAAANVTLNSSAPAGLTIVSVISSQGVCSQALPTTCQWDALPAGGEATVTLLARLDANAPATPLIMEATVNAATPDPDSSNNSAGVTSIVLREADLAVRNTSPADPAIAGTTFTLQLAVENKGPSSATAVAVEASLPTSVTFQTAGSSAGCLAVAAKVQCTVDTLAPGASTVLAIQVALDPDLPEAQLAFPSTVQASEADPLAENNSIVVTQPVERRTDLALHERSTASPVIAGSSMSYTFTVTNLGPSTSSGSQLLDELPQGMTLQSSASTSTCAVDGRLTRCGVGILRPGHVQTVTITVNIDPSIEVNAQYHNYGTIVAGETDPVATNNQTESSVWIVRRNLLAVTQKLLNDNILPGTLLDYEVTVRNSGDSMATGLKLYNTLPDDTLFDAAHSSPNCTASGREVICNLGSLLNQSQSSVYIRTRLDKDVAGWTKLRNEVTLVANELGDAKVQSQYESNVTGFVYLPLIQHAGETTKPGEIDLVVDSIEISAAGVTITVRNAGTAPLLPSNSFWLDLYVNPDLPPNQPGQVWSDLGPAGMAWGVQSEALRLHPGEVVTLTVGDRYYDSAFSQVPASLAAGTQIYVQADSVNKTGVTYGNVLEGHEVRHEPYNNIKSISLTDTVSTEIWPVKSSLEGPSASSASDAGLPKRK